MHSDRFSDVKYWFSHKLWSEARVRNAVVSGWITEEEFKEITGNDY